MEESVLKQFELELRQGVKGEVSFDDYTLGIYATDASIFQIMPLALAQTGPRSPPGRRP